jgi:hypothetical protein
MFSERYRPHDELIVYTRRKRRVNSFIRWTMAIITAFAALLVVADLGLSRGGCMGGFVAAFAIFGWIMLMPVCAIAWVIALLCVSNARFRPYWQCSCGYDLRGTITGGPITCPECGRTVQL